MKTFLKTFYLLPLNAPLKKLQSKLYKEVLDFARHRLKKPELQDLSGEHELEMLCDLWLLLRAGVVSCQYTDSLADESGEGIFLKLEIE